MARFLVTADIHANRKRINSVVKLFEKCKAIITEQNVELI